MKDEQRFREIISKVKDDAVERVLHRELSRKVCEGPAVPDWLSGKTLYEVYLRNFSQQRTFRALTQRLDHLKEQGFDVLWLMPVWEIGEKDRKGSQGCPYAVRDYYTLNAEYGGENKLRELVNEVHKRGMHIIIDMVANHVAPDYRLLENEPGLIQRDEKGNPKRKVAGWSDITDLNYDNPETREHMRGVIKYWLEKFNLDGFRCDVAGMVPLDFWKKLIPELEAINPNIYMLAEWDGAMLHRRAFHSTYDWVLNELMVLVREGKESAHVLLEWQRLRRDYYPQNALPLRFLENHDKQRAAKVFGVKEQIPFLVVVYTFDGLPLVYNGQEIGAMHKPSLFEHEPIEWENGDADINAIYKRLIDLRKAYPLMTSGDIRQHVHNAIPDVLLYEKPGDKPLLVGANMRGEERKLQMPATLAGRLGRCRELFNSSKQLDCRENELKLEPWQAFIVELVK